MANNNLSTNIPGRINYTGSPDIQHAGADEKARDIAKQLNQLLDAKQFDASAFARGLREVSKLPIQNVVQMLNDNPRIADEMFRSVPAEFLDSDMSPVKGKGAIHNIAR